MDESLPSTAPSAHSGFSNGNPGLYVIIIITMIIIIIIIVIIIIGTSVCDNNHSLTIVTNKGEGSKFDSS